MLLKINKFGESENFKQITMVAKSALDLAKKLYGEKTLIYFKTMLKYATTLSKCKDTREEGIKIFMSGLLII